MATFEGITKGIIAILKVTALLVIVIGGAVLLVVGFAELHTESFPQSAVTSAMVVVGGLTFLFILTIVLLLFRRVFRSIFAHKTVFGATPSARLIGFGVAVLFFPGAIRDGIVALLRFVTTLISTIPSELSRSWFKNSSMAGGDFRIDQVFQFLILMLQPLWTGVAQALNEAMSMLPITNLLFALVVWAVAGQVLSSSQVGQQLATSNPVEGSRLAAYFRALSAEKRHNFSLFLLFLFSTYLSIAAIVAVPWLQEKELPVTLNKERLQQTLQGSLLPDADFDKRFQQNYRSNIDPFSKLAPLLNLTADSLERSVTPPSKLPVDFKNAWDNKIRQINDETEGLRKRRSEIIEGWNQFRNDVRQYEQSLLSTALSNFETDMLSPMSTQERVYYFQEVDRWFRESLGALQRSLAKCMSYIETRDQLLTALANDVQQRLEQDLNRAMASQFSSSDVGTRSFLELLSSGGPYIYTDSYSLFELPSELELRPAPPEPGLGWGPFGWISKWLLRTKSLALALITGMLGFGLFGAAISSFVREQPVDDAGKRVVRSIANIVVKGMSAAVVIFLAVEGGLAVFTVGSGEPNAYVLFFTCLVGSVFSEDVWIRARKKFVQNLPGEGSVSPGTPSEQREITPGQLDSSSKPDKPQ
jgi:hypothetical protein